MRVGVYDPSFSLSGHHLAFNAYITRLLLASDVEVFLFGNDEMLDSEFFKNFNVNKTSLPKIKFPEWIWPRSLKVIYKLASDLQAIRNTKIDILLFTSEFNATTCYLFPMNVPYGQFILWPDRYRSHTTGWRSWHMIQMYQELLFRRWLRRAKLLFTTNEPTIQDGVYRVSGRKDFVWIQNMPFDKEISAEKSVIERNKYDFVSVGTVARRKNYSFAIDALKYKNINFSWLIAGFPQGDYGQMIEAKIMDLQKKGDQRFKGVFKYLDEGEYEEYLLSAKWLLLPYDFGRTNISSQVLHDALAVGMPFIAPDRPLFRFYADTYGVGLLYKEGDTISFVETIKKALQEGPDKYCRAIRVIREKYSFENIAKEFSKALKGDS